MRARIIFRGLTLFTFDRPTPDDPKTGSGTKFESMTAWLMSDPDPKMKMPEHTHTPHWGLIGRSKGAPNGPGRVETKKPMSSDLTIELKGTDRGVTVDGSFLAYVPRLAALYGPGAPPFNDVLAALANQNPKAKYVTRRIEIKNGTVRAGDFISWEWYGNTPAKVAYMDTRFQGYAANEVIVDVGDDDDIDEDDKDKFLAIDSLDGKVKEELVPTIKGKQLSDDIDPNTVELLITNLTARRRRPVFWGLHFQTLFDGAAYPPRDNYENSDQYIALDAAARAYDEREWTRDLAVRRRQSFPFLIDIDPVADKLDKIERATDPYVMKDPKRFPFPIPNSVRQSGEGVPGDDAMSESMSTPAMAMAGATSSAGEGGPGCDPLNVWICPFGRE